MLFRRFLRLRNDDACPGRRLLRLESGGVCRIRRVVGELWGCHAFRGICRPWCGLADINQIP